MKDKIKVLGMAVICMGLLITGGCADTTLSDTALGYVVIKAPVQKVFNYITAEDADWDKNLKEVTNVDGTGFGSTSNWVYTVGGQEYRGEAATTEFVRNRKLVTVSAGEIDSTWTWLFVPQADETKLVLIIEYSLEMPKAVSMAKGVFAKKLDDDLDTALQDLKKKIEEE